MSGRVTEEWCYSLDEESYTECETARVRAEAVAEASAHARAAEHSRVWIARVKRYRHEDFVHGIGERVSEWINERASEDVGELADDYPGVGPGFVEAVEDAIIAVVTQRSDSQPTFFQAESPEEIVVAPEPPTSTGLLSPEQEALRQRISETAEAHEAIGRDLSRLLVECKHIYLGDKRDCVLRLCAICLR